MELTQRLECTQELYPNSSEKAFPEQVGFLGICGTKYPLKKGPNKIGRDPATCNIILNFNSISRQHAVINILNSNEFMLMDLDSANKTKLSDKTLDAYIPHPLKNGDVVQFGQIFGVFRLLEEDTDLPMTQALDIPETPVQKKVVSKLNSVHATTIPESPDVSDREESFIAPSQPKPRNVFKSPSNNFIKTSGKTISIKPVGTNKIDNVYWSSSKKSDSFSLQSSNDDISLLSDVNTSNPPNIHELETQVPYKNNDSTDSIYNAITQVVEKLENPTSPTIYNVETQIPTDLPQVCKIQDQHDVHFNFTTDNKENDNNIFNAETQVEPRNSTPSKIINGDPTSNPLSSENIKDKDDLSDDVILFDDIDTPLEDNFESQALIPAGFDIINENQEVAEDVQQSQEITFKRAKRICRIKSDSSTDCEDINIAMTQKIPEIENDINDRENMSNVAKSVQGKDKMVVVDDDITDCEDNIDENDFIPPNNKVNIEKGVDKIVIDDDVTDCEDNDDEENIIPPNKQKNIDEMDTQIIDIDAINVNKNIVSKDNARQIDFEDIPTQVIEEKNISKQEEVGFDELPTQILAEEPDKDVCFEEQLTQNICSEEIIPKFKVPKPSPFKGKKKNIPELKIVNQIINSSANKSNDDIDDELYYAATQEIFNDLCSQREFSQEVVKIRKTSKDNNDRSKVSITENIASTSFSKDSSAEIDIEEKIENFVNSLSNSQIVDVVGANISPRKSLEPKASTKTVNPATFSKSLNSNENKNTSSSSKSGDFLKKSSESKSENSVRSPIAMRQRKEPTNTRTELNEKVDLLPTRVITRVRKPTPKMRNNDEGITNLSNSKHSSKTDKKSEKAKEAKVDDNKGRKEKSSKRQIKSDEFEKNDKRDSKSSKRGTKDKTKQAEIEAQPSSSSRKKHKSEEAKQSNSKSSSEKVQKDILSYLNNTDRRTRSRSNQKNDANEKREEEKVKTSINDGEKKSHRSRNKEKKRESSEKEVRRSKRQVSQKMDENLGNDAKSNASTSKGHHEQSVVYDLSSGSAVDSPSKLKRPATEVFEVPSTKKSKMDSNSKNLSLRATPAREVKTHYVLFTAFPCEEVKVKLEKLGAIIVTDVLQCTMVLTKQIKRTFKLLCAVGLGKPIVGPSWVQACVDTNIIADPWQYLIKDFETERRFQFNLERSLASQRNFLKGYNVSSTPSVVPNAAEMKLIVECSGGTWKDCGPNWICISSLADEKFWPSLKKKGAVIVSTEFILAGVLRQRVEIDRNKLC